MIKKIKNFLALALAFMFILSSALLVSAHPIKQYNILKSEYMPAYGDYYVGGESVGWSIDEEYHAGHYYLNYLWKSGDACLTTARKTIFQQGAAKWAACGTIEEEIGGNTYLGGKLGTYDGGTSGVVASNLASKAENPSYQGSLSHF